MSINGVNQNQDIQKLLKLMKSSQGRKAGAANKLPAHLTMNGSIFNAPGLGNNANTISSVNLKTLNNTRNLEGTQTTDNVLKANTTKSVSDVSKTGSTSKTEGAKGQESNEKEQIDIGN